jgi:hypothetical protein
MSASSSGDVGQRVLFGRFARRPRERVGRNVARQVAGQIFAEHRVTARKRLIKREVGPRRFPLTFALLGRHTLGRYACLLLVEALALFDGVDARLRVRTVTAWARFAYPTA